MIFFSTVIMFYALFFAYKERSWKTLYEHINDPMMYLCFLLSFIFSIVTAYWVGAFNKENVRKITTMETDEKDS